MKDFSLGRTMGLLIKTAPFLLFRLITYLVIVVASMVFIGGGGAIGNLVGRIGEDPSGPTLFGAVAGFVLVSGFLYWIREYILYMTKAGHIAVLVELQQGKTLPGGKGQIDYAQQIVRQRFKESSLLFGLDQLIKGVLKMVNRTFLSLAAIIPLPGLEAVVGFMTTVLNLSLTYLDEVILAYCIKNESQNPWKSSQTALVLYAQNYKTFLKNAVFMALFIYAITLFIFILVLLPVAGMIVTGAGAGSGFTILLGLVFAWAIKQAIIEPIGMTAMMQVFFSVTAGQNPNPEWDAKLDSLSDKFREIKGKAASAGYGSSVHPNQGAV